jgi:hypothetical protein
LIRSRRAAHDVRPTTVRLAARSAVAVVSTFTLVDVIRTFMAIGQYEHRITVVTHGQPDVWVAAMAYALFDAVVDELRYVLGFRVEASTVGELIWMLALILAVAAVAMWLHQVRVMPRMDMATIGWLGVAALLKVVSAVYNAVTAPPAPSIGGVLATRPVAYSLWIVSTVVVVVAALRVVRAIRRTTVE